jgi:uncharacterized protein (TIGR00106 family)
MAIVQVTVVPLGTKTSSLSSYIADIHRVLEEDGITNHLTPMGTVLEGPLERIMEVIQKIHEVPFNKGANRVMTLVNIDDRRDKQASAKDKIKSVRDKLAND